MRKFIMLVAIFAAIMTASAQAQLDYKTIKDIVDNEKEYYNDILRVY